MRRIRRRIQFGVSCSGQEVGSHAGRIGLHQCRQEMGEPTFVRRQEFETNAGGCEARFVIQGTTPGRIQVMPGAASAGDHQDPLL